MNLVANECVQCGCPCGYVTREAVQIPTLCPLCAVDPGTMKDWGHKLDKREKPINEVLKRMWGRLRHIQFQ